MYPIPTRVRTNVQPHHPQMMMPHIPIKQMHLSPSRQSQASNYGLRPEFAYPSHRVSTVSFQKVSMATRGTQNEIAGKISILTMQNPKSQRFFFSENPYCVQKQVQSSRLDTFKQTTRLVRHVSPVQKEEKPMIKKQLQVPVSNQIPNNSQIKTQNIVIEQTKPIKQIRPTIEEPIEQIIMAPPKARITSLSKVPKVQQNLLIPKMEIKNQNSNLSPKKQKLESKTPKRTITQSSAAPLVSTYTVQNIQLPTKIRNPPTRINNNRLYRSAVYDRRGLSVRPASRARSVCSFVPKHKQKEVYVRCPHRSFISDKKIPVIGSYISNDKSKNCVIRQLATNLPLVSQSRIIGAQLIEIIPAQIIKMPICKAQETRFEQYDHSILNDDIYSYTDNYIIDQPTLIKQYLPDNQYEGSLTERKNNLSQHSFSSSRSRRLSDNIKISVYRSPSVIIKKAETITSGPKLSKNHVMRVAVEGKVISGYDRQSESSKRSSSPQGARYENINVGSQRSIIDSVKNPYSKQNIADIVLRLKKETEEKVQNQSQIFISYSNNSIVLKDDSKNETMISDFNIASSQHTVSKTETQLAYSIHKQQSLGINLKSNAEMNFTDYLQSSHKRKEQVNKILFESPAIAVRKEHTESAFNIEESKIEKQVSIKSFGQSLSFSNITKHKYKIPKLSSDLEQDLKRLRLENEKKKKLLEDNWTAVKSITSFSKID